MTLGGSGDSTLAKLEDAKSSLNPDSRRELGLAGVLVRRGRGPEAEAVLRRAIAREPENVYLWVGLARVQVTTGRPAAAERSYDRARELNAQIPRRGLPAPLE
jgi:Flp pilus assembly protein TadD